MDDETSTHRSLVYEAPIRVSLLSGCRSECERSASRAKVAGKGFSRVDDSISIVIDAPIVSKDVSGIEGHSHHLSGHYGKGRSW